MTNAEHVTIRPNTTYLNTQVVGDLEHTIANNAGARMFQIDLSDACDADTASLACLVMIRRKLLRSGRDLRISGLQHRVRILYQLTHLTHVLPADNITKAPGPNMKEIC